jgi:hypothetical protein
LLDARLRQRRASCTASTIRPGRCCVRPLRAAMRAVSASRTSLYFQMVNLRSTMVRSWHMPGTRQWPGTPANLKYRDYS